MASREDLIQLQHIIGHEFNDETLGITALTAADRSDEAGSSDGNRRLAQIGSIVLELMSCDASWTEDDDRAQANQKLSSRVNYHHLASIALSSGIYKLMKFSPRQKLPLPDRVLSKAVQAVAGAVWRDTEWNFGKVTQAIYQLKCYGSTCYQQSFTTEPDLKPAEQTIDPAVLTVKPAQMESNQNPLNFVPMASEVMNMDVDPLDYYKTNTFCEDNWPELSDRHDLTVDWSLCENSCRADETLEVRLNDFNILILPTESQQIAELPNKYVFGNVLASSPDVAAEASTNEPLSLQRHAEAKNSVSQPGPSPKSLQKLKKSQRDIAEGSKRVEELRQNEAAKWSHFGDLGGASVKYSYSIESLKQRASECQVSDGGNFVAQIFLMLTSSTSVLYLKEVLRSHRKDAGERLFDHSPPQTPKIRFDTIQSLSNDISRNILLRRYHILQLYIDCLDSYSAGIQEGFIVNTPANTSIPKPSEMGNPLHLAKKRTTNAMIQRIFPQATDTYRSKQEKKVKLLQRLGESLFTLTKGGSRLGILALLPTEVSVLGIEPPLNLSDANLMEASVAEIQMLVNHLEHSTKHFSQFIATGYEVLELVLKMSSDRSKQFLFEIASSEDIEARPADSIDLLHFLRQV